MINVHIVILFLLIVTAAPAFGASANEQKNPVCNGLHGSLNVSKPFCGEGDHKDPEEFHAKPLPVETQTRKFQICLDFAFKSRLTHRRSVKFYKKAVQSALTPEAKVAIWPERSHNCPAI